MSDTAPQQSPQREQAGCSLGIALGLLVLFGLVGSMVAQKTRLADGEQLFAEWFEEHALPFGFEVAGATVEMRGEHAVLLTRPGAPAEAERAERPELEWGEKREDPEPFDWSEVESGAAGGIPLEAVVVEYPAKIAADELDTLFGFPSGNDGGEVEITDIDSDGGRVMMNRGRVDWGPYSTMYVMERELEWGGTFRDVVRVNLSLPDQPRVLFVRWSRGFPASLERVSELLAALVAKSAPEQLAAD